MQARNPIFASLMVKICKNCMCLRAGTTGFFLQKKNPGQIRVDLPRKIPGQIFANICKSPTVRRPVCFPPPISFVSLINRRQHTSMPPPDDDAPPKQPVFDNPIDFHSMSNTRKMKMTGKIPSLRILSGKRQGNRQSTRRTMMTNPSQIQTSQIQTMSRGEDRCHCLSGEQRQ
jgi:hypothetical protein